MANITLTAAQRETLISMDGEVRKTTDKHGNAVYAKISAWKGVRLYVEFRYEYHKNSEKTYISLTDANDLVVSLGETCAEILLDWINANMPATAEEIATVEYEVTEEMASGAIVEVAFPYALANIVDRVNQGHIRVDASGEYGTPRAISWGGMGAGANMKRTIVIERADLVDFIARVAKLKAQA